MLKVLVVDDELALRESLAELVGSLGHTVFSAKDGLECMSVVRNQPVDLVLLDVQLPHIDGLEALKLIKEYDPSITVLMITAHGRLNDAIIATRAGAFDYVEKPVSSERIKAAIARAIEARELVRHVSYSSPTLVLGPDPTDGQFIGESPSMRSVFALIHRISQVCTSVLIQGENGTGKELVARAIHFNSPRKNRRFVAINCGAIPENLAESELFGHEKGAFTGADQRKIGRFQFAEGGTLFLDEVGDITPGLQVKLLRVLQERKFTPVGSNREIASDVRIIAATNKNISALVKAGKFREDLYYRLNVIQVSLPSLRQRTEDIPLLVEYFIKKFQSVHGPMVTGVSPSVMRALQAYSWPGNIRELENTIERAFVLATGPIIVPEVLPEPVQVHVTAADPSILEHQGGMWESQEAASSDSEIQDYQHEKEIFERDFIIRALRQFGGRINLTAHNAGIPKNTLLRKIKKYDINPRQWEEHGSSS